MIETMEEIKTEKQVKNVAKKERELVIFKLGDEEFGVSIEYVKEIVKLPEITLIPNSIDYIAGICNLRGSVLPVIDTRIRFNLTKKETTSQTRLLVVDLGGETTGLIVDAVSQVLSISEDIVDPAPRAAAGIDKDFLDGVVKLNDGKRLVLLLNLSEVFSAQTEKVKVKSKASYGMKNETEESNLAKQAMDEEQLVSFLLSDEEYAFDIDSVREILRVIEITEVPNVPNYVLGLLNIRDQILPILDLRTMLSIKHLGKELYDVLDEVKTVHNEWISLLEQCVNDGTGFSGQRDPTVCRLGMWIAGFKNNNNNLTAMVAKLVEPHNTLHAYADLVTAEAAKSKESALKLISDKVIPLKNNILDTFTKVVESFYSTIKDEQRILVIESDGTTIGLVVDHVNEVVRIPKNIIDETPPIIASSGKEISGVAKMNGGKRIIMIMDEKTLFKGDKKMLKEMAKGSSGADKNASEAKKDLDEDQFVTFKIGNEEYGVQIMKVQEINRLSEITSIPKAPYFIDGVTNLRGNVIPIIDIRKRFAMEIKTDDYRTRIIVVDIAGKKTGLKVDMVNEVLRLYRSDIEEAPGIISSNVDSDFIEGIGKIDNGKRMIILLNVERILTSKEIDALKSIGKSDSAEKNVKLQAKNDDAEAVEEVKSKSEASGISEEKSEKPEPKAAAVKAEKVPSVKDSTNKKAPEDDKDTGFTMSE